MFRIENNVPDVYIEESRDFQLVSRLYDLALQSTRFSIDTMLDISDTLTCPAEVLPLLATKVGFFDNLELNDKTYRKLISAFPYIIRYKGSITAINLIVNLFMQLANTDVVMTQDEQNVLTIQFNTYASDTDLLQHLLEYVRPTGMMIKYGVTTKINRDSDPFSQTDNVSITNYQEAGDAATIQKSYSASAGHIGLTQIVRSTGKSEIKEEG